MQWENEFTKSLGIQYPIIQAPMLGVSTPEMAAAVANAGGLGSLAVGGLSPQVTKQLIQKTKSLTNKPFAVNLFVHKVPVYKEEEILPMKNFMLSLAVKRGYALSAEDLSAFTFYTYHDQLDILMKEKIPVVSFTFDCLDKKSIALLKQNNSVLIGTATCVQEAKILEEHGVDMIVAQGIEAGGHRGSFIEDMELPQIGLFSLLPQIIQQTTLPVIAAGGINSCKTIRAALEMGAAAVQVGSAFLACNESEAIEAYKKLLPIANANDTALTKSFSGRWARGIRNEFMNEIESSGIAIPPYPVQNSITMKFRKLAQQHNDKDYTTLWAGQSCNTCKMKSAKEIFLDLLNE